MRKNQEKEEKSGDLFLFVENNDGLPLIHESLGGGGAGIQRKKNGPPYTPTPPPWLEIQRELGEQAPGIT